MLIYPEASPLHRWRKSMAGLIRWSGLWPWKAKMIMADLRNLAGDFGPDPHPMAGGAVTPDTCLTMGRRC